MRSNTCAGNFSRCSSAKRYSIVTFLPSTKPTSASPLRNAAVNFSVGPDRLPERNPTIGIACCCAYATTGHATALPKSVMNSRRLITGPPRVRTSHRNGKIEWLGGVLDVRFGLKRTLLPHRNYSQVHGRERKAAIHR